MRILGSLKEALKGECVGFIDFATFGVFGEDADILRRRGIVESA